MTDHTRTEKIGGDSIDLFLVFQVMRETVMAGMYDLENVDLKELSLVSDLVIPPKFKVLKFKKYD